MSRYQRPWWLLVNKSAGLITTIDEESGSDERCFRIRGEPLVQGLAWLTWGPVAALVVILVLTGLAIGLNVRAQSGAIRFLFVAAFLILPALAWGAVTIVANRLAAKHLTAERRAETQECFIRLNQQRGELAYGSNRSDEDKRFAFGRIRQVRVSPGIGVRDRKSMCLTLDTDSGAVVLLNEKLGTRAQKADLAHEIQNALNSFASK